MFPSWGRGHNASLNVAFEVNGATIRPWSCWVYPPNPNVSVNFEWIVDRGLPLEQVETFLATLEQIPGFRQQLGEVRSAGFKKRPGISIDPVLAQRGAMDAFGGALADLLGKVWST